MRTTLTFLLLAGLTGGTAASGQSILRKSPELV